MSGPQPVTIAWDPATTMLTVDFGDDGVDLTWNNDIIANFFGGNPLVYWGFTGATGTDFSAVQSVCDIALTVIGPAIPTMGEWGLILLALLILNFGTLAITSGKLQLAGSGGGFSIGNIYRNLPFNAVVYGKMLTVSLLFIVSGFALAIAFYGYNLTGSDIPGVLICTPVLVYLIFLVVGNSDRSL